MKRIQTTIIAAPVLLAALGIIAAARGEPPTTQTSAGEPHTSSVPPRSNDFASLSLEDLMDVEVTSVSKQKQRISDAPAAITVIGQEDIQRSGLSNIPELLRLAPGMNVAQMTANTWAISARGLNGQYANNLLVLMDGRSIYTPAFGGVVWNGVDYPLADLDRIEVIRGPGSTLWGANAVNGVVNITTKSAEQTQGWMMSTRAGTEESDLSVRYGGRIDDLTAFRVYTKSRYTENAATTDGDQANDRWKALQGGFRIDRQGSPKDTLTLQGDLYGQQLDSTLATFFGPSHYSGDQNGQNLLARWTHRESDQAETSLQIYYNRMEVNLRPAGWVENTLDIDFQNRFSLSDRQEITWGLGARTTWVTFSPTEPGFTVSPESTNQFIFSGFIQDRITIVPDRLQWYVGTKLQYENFTGFDVQPGTRLLWTPDANHTVWAAVSRSLRLPALYEQTDISYPPFFVLRSDDPGVEKSMSYEIGYKTKLTPTLTVDVTAFANTYRDLITHDSLGGVTRNGPSAETYGAELSANWQATPQWRLSGSYTLLQTVFHDAGGSSDASDRENSSPKNQFQIHSYLDITKNLQFNTSLYYVQSLGAVDSRAGGESVPGYTRVDMAIAWRPRENVTLSAGIQNLFDDRHPENTTVPFGVLPSETQRAAYVQLNIAF